MDILRSWIDKKTGKTLDNVKVVQKCGRWRFEIK